jgi:hypothetical protein
MEVVQKMKDIITEKGIIVASTNAWYQSAYPSVDKGIFLKVRINPVDHWWRKSQSCGPIVEQATHLCTSFTVIYLIKAIYLDI